jgi:hypothetical protein
MKKQFTAIFDINKQFPQKYREYKKILVQFKQPYRIYYQYSLEPNFLLLETPFLARFKRAMYDGRIAPLSELRELVIPKSIFVCIDTETRSTTFIDFKNNTETHIFGDSLEFLDTSILDTNWIENQRPQVISEAIFAKEFIEYYKLDNLHNSKLMKIYNSNYFDGFGIQTDKNIENELSAMYPVQDQEVIEI